MAKTNKPQLDIQRVASLAGVLGGLIQPFKGAAQDTAEARDALDNQRKGEVNVREQIMVSVADFSQAHQLETHEIEAVASKVCAAHNDDATRKTLETFVGEIKVAMRPGVRDQVPATVTLRNTCWDNEEECKRLDKDQATPLRDTFKRKYHMLKQMLSAIEDGWRLDTAEDVESFRQDVETKQRENTKTIVKELARMSARLRELAQTFPLDDITEAAQSLDDVDEARLKASLTPKPAVKVVAMPVAAPTPTVVPTGMSERVGLDDEAEAEAEIEVAEGVVDPLAAALGEESVSLAA